MYSILRSRIINPSRKINQNHRFLNCTNLYGQYKNNEFEYDLRTDMEGRCFARIKSSGEICEISKEAMRLLRREEKRLQRENELKRLLTTDFAEDDDQKNERKRAAVLYPLSLSENRGETESRESSWLGGFENVEDTFFRRVFIQELLEILSPQQQRVFHEIILEGSTYQEYAEKSGISKSRVSVIMQTLRKEEFVFDTND